jgi:hypothetical protein
LTQLFCDGLILSLTPAGQWASAFGEHWEPRLPAKSSPTAKSLIAAVRCAVDSMPTPKA